MISKITLSHFWNRLGSCLCDVYVVVEAIKFYASYSLLVNEDLNS